LLKKIILLFAILWAACSSISPTATSELPPTVDFDDSDKDEASADLCDEPSCCSELPGKDGLKWYHEAVGYEVFVRSFYDSDGDGIGDLNGIIEKIDYLNDGDDSTSSDLGVTLLWLMPTSPSPSYHGYDVVDYKGVNADYGTADDMKKLVEEAHKRGIRIILDLVMNHSSDKHPWFVESGISGSPRRDWYVWSDEIKNWPRPWSGKANTWHKQGDSWYYGIFWSGMPDLNYTNPEVRKEMKEIARYWLSEFQVDGFRLDAVRYIVETGPKKGMEDTAETIDWWVEFSTDIGSDYPDALLVGEAWASNNIASKYHGGGSGLQLTFDFDLMEAVVAGLLAEEPADIERVLCSFAEKFPPGAGDASFLANHDIMRLASRLKGDEKLMRLGAVLLYLLPGTPFIYYGQEIGMRNGPTTDDKQKRRPMQWDAGENAGFSAGKPWKAPNKDYTTINVAVQEKDSDSLLALYRELIGLRKGNKALSLGGFLPVKAESTTNHHLWAFLRKQNSQNVACVVNFNETSAMDAKVSVAGTPYSGARRLWPEEGEKRSVQGEWLEVGDVGPYSAEVFELLD